MCWLFPCPPVPFRPPLPSAFRHPVLIMAPLLLPRLPGHPSPASQVQTLPLGLQASHTCPQLSSAALTLRHLITHAEFGSPFLPQSCPSVRCTLRGTEAAWSMCALNARSHFPCPSTAHSSRPGSRAPQPVLSSLNPLSSLLWLLLALPGTLLVAPRTAAGAHSDGTASPSSLQAPEGSLHLSAPRRPAPGAGGTRRPGQLQHVLLAWPVPSFHLSWGESPTRARTGSS